MNMKSICLLAREHTSTLIALFKQILLYQVFCYHHNNFFDSEIAINIIKLNRLSGYDMPYVTSYVHLINSNNPPINQYCKLNVAERQTGGRKPYYLDDNRHFSEYIQANSRK